MSRKLLVINKFILKLFCCRRICGVRARVEHSNGKIRPKPWLRDGRGPPRRRYDPYYERRDSRRERRLVYFLLNPREIFLFFFVKTKITFKTVIKQIVKNLKTNKHCYEWQNTATSSSANYFVCPTHLCIN